MKFVLEVVHLVRVKEEGDKISVFQCRRVNNWKRNPIKLLKDCLFSKNIKHIGVISTLGVSWRMAEKCQNGIPSAEKANSSGCLQTSLTLHDDTISCEENSFGRKRVPWRLGLQSSCQGNSMSILQIPGPFLRRFGSATNNPSLSREWLVKHWLVDTKNGSSIGRRKQRNRKHVQNSERLLSDANVTEQSFTGQPYSLQPPLSQSTTGFLKPESSEEFKIAPLLARSNLLITRDIEWANLVLGFEQENRYAIVDPCFPQGPVGFILEQSNVIARQILRTRRPFVASITDAMGNVLFKVRRPFWWITSSIFAEIDGKEIGVVHRQWHLWRRVYNLYLGNEQFAVVENPGFWNWTFTLKDIDGKVLASIDRDWRGFGFEVLTDAGQYAIRFGDADPMTKTGLAASIQELEIVRPLTLSERAVVLALAVSLDNDYFSRHRGRGLLFLVATE